ncbi:MAG: hypothetical protein ACRDKT_11070 [Actinomycetota bacterium]
MERKDAVSKRVQPRANTVDELGTVLRAQSVEDRFLELPIDEQLGYVDWIDRAPDDAHRARRMRMIVAVIAQSSSSRTIQLGED